MSRFLKTIAAWAVVALTLFSCSGEPAFATGIGATGLNTQLSVQGDITQSPSVTSGVSENQHLNISQFLQFGGGTGAGQVDTTYVVNGSISASSSTTLALTGLTDAFGNSISFGHVKAIILLAAAGNTNDVVISPGASNPFPGPWGGTSPTQAVSPGEMYVTTKGESSAVGWVVTPSTGMNLKLANSSSGTSVTYTLIILGTST